MTPRDLYGMGLIAGISVKDAGRMRPGFIMDMFAARRHYDAGMNGVEIRKNDNPFE